MKNKPLYLLDVDDVLADFTIPILKHANQASLERDPTFVAKQFEDVTVWDLETLYPDLTFEQLLAPALLAGFASSLEPLPGSLEAVKELQSLGRVVILTAPFRSASTWTSDRDAWLKATFKIEYQDIVHSSDKSLVPGDLFLDDKPANIEAWQKRWPDGEALLWNAPYNQAEPERGRRVHTWEEVLKIARSIAAF